MIVALERAADLRAVAMMVDSADVRERVAPLRRRRIQFQADMIRRSPIKGK